MNNGNGIASSLPGLLQERATRQPDSVAYTFIDYEKGPNGFAERLTWFQVYRRASVVAEELRLCGPIGDRAAILAPHGLDYIAAFLGALQAGFIAVPLPVPQSRGHDERVSPALRDCSPSVVLTASSVVDEVSKYVRNDATVVEVDLLDLHSPGEIDADSHSHPRAAYIQYTSGSTRQPAGVVVSHRNVIANLEQACRVYSEDSGTLPPPDVTFVSWLPFHHDMGLIFSICTPLYSGNPIALMSPESFLLRPARWMQLLAKSGRSYSCAPNFALDLAARRTSDDDMAGLDLSNVLGIINGAERVHPATIKRFNERFARFNLKDTVIIPSYGLAEATLFVAARSVGDPALTVRFDSEQLSSGQAKPYRNGTGRGIDLVSYGAPWICTLRIVNPDTRAENPPGALGEIWVHGDNVTTGYWQKNSETESTFGATLVSPSPGTPAGPWLRTGDLGVISDGELFIVGRIKDVLIVDGRNHYPDDIEATIQEIVTAGQAAAIAVPDDQIERLVVIIEVNKGGGSTDENAQKFRSVKREIISAISNSHGLRVSDVVLVPPGSVPLTTSGKVRRSACVERYRHNEFRRLDVSADLLDEAW